MCMPGSHGTTGHIVDVVRAGDVKGQMVPSFNHCQITASIYDFWQLDRMPSLGLH